MVQTLDEEYTGERKTGYIERNYATSPLGAVPYCAPFDLPIIPRSEWKDRIDYMTEHKTRLTDILEFWEYKAGDQDGYGYCWAWGTVQAFILIRAAMGLPFAHLNPHALAAQVMGFRDRGGNTFDAIPWLVEHGCPTFETWPGWSMNRALAESKVVKEDAIQYRLTEWYELRPNNFDQKATCLLNGIPVIAGYSHLGHMMADLDLKYRENRGQIEFGVDTLNSWGATNNGNGRMLLWGQKAVSFDQAAPRVSTTSA
jgi:hypothetical protein